MDGDFYREAGISALTEMTAYVRNVRMETNDFDAPFFPDALLSNEKAQRMVYGNLSINW